ncbi:MAG: TolC family protein [Campylobacterales bacterium]
MKWMAVVTGCALSLFAREADLQSLLDAAGSSDAAKASEYAVQAHALNQRSELLSGGVRLNAQAGYADAKETSDDAIEFSIAVEKPFRLADGSAVERALDTGTEISVRMERARLQNRIYGHYIDACRLREELWLLEDAHSRGQQMETLIRTGMEGGEFDRSAWLRSRLNVQTLSLQIDDLDSRYAETLALLGASVQSEVSGVRCSDLPERIVLPPQSVFEHAPLLRQLENRLAGSNALKTYRDTWLPEVTLGAGYDDEMDLQRGILYASVPLGGGSRRENEREAARRDALADAAALRTMQRTIAARVAAFTAVQETRQWNLRRLNDELIPDAYETTELLRERFMGSEASYLEYIDSQKALFALLMEGVRLRAGALKAEAELFARLGISPALNKDNK